MSLFHIRHQDVTAGGFDNIDHNQSPTTAKSALHGTYIGLSIQQKNYSEYKQKKMRQKHVKSLPACYRMVYLALTISHDEIFHIPPLNISHSYPVPQPVTKTIFEDGYWWLDDVKKLLEIR